MDTEKQKKIVANFISYLRSVFKNKNIPTEINSVAISVVFFGSKQITTEQFVKSFGLKNVNATTVREAFNRIDLESFIFTHGVTDEYLPWFNEKTAIFTKIQTEFTRIDIEIESADYFYDKLRSFCKSNTVEIRKLYDFVEDNERISDIGKDLDGRLSRRFVNDWDSSKIEALTFDQFNRLWFDDDLVPALLLCHRRRDDIRQIF